MKPLSKGIRFRSHMCCMPIWVCSAAWHGGAGSSSEGACIRPGTRTLAPNCTLRVRLPTLSQAHLSLKILGSTTPRAAAVCLTGGLSIAGLTFPLAHALLPGQLRHVAEADVGELNGEPPAAPARPAVVQVLGLGGRHLIAELSIADLVAARLPAPGLQRTAMGGSGGRERRR